MTPFPPVRRPSPRSPAVLRLSAVSLIALLAWGAAPAGGQESADPEAGASAPAERDPRPQPHAYTVLDGRSVPRPLGGAVGEAARGRAIYADPALGGCSACHAAPGLPRAIFVPHVLAERAPTPEPEPELPPALDDPSADGLEPNAEPVAESNSRLAPEIAAPPPARPDPEAQSEETAGDDSADPSGEDPDAVAAAAALLPLPQGPDLAGVAARREIGELRLSVINPRIAREASRMPAYHNVSLAQAALTPALRQPWLSAQEVEDVVAYLATLDGEDASPVADPTRPDGAADAAPENEPSPDGPNPDEPDPDEPDPDARPGEAASPTPAAGPEGAPGGAPPAEAPAPEASDPAVSPEAGDAPAAPETGDASTSPGTGGSPPAGEASGPAAPPEATDASPGDTAN
ncbi:hypothetical protein [uncultured Albimonas sp.]|uniref:hypothetical protein n=1 Tax=uncultured Albimonas sp. TaxID=1331701 RepID=UPI0030EC2D08